MTGVRGTIAILATFSVIGCSDILGIEEVPDPSGGGAGSSTRSSGGPSTTPSATTSVDASSTGVGGAAPRCELGSTVVDVTRLSFTPTFINFAGAHPAPPTATDAVVLLHGATNDYGTLLRGLRQLAAPDDPYTVAELRPRLDGALLLNPQEPVAHAGGFYFSAQRESLGMRDLFWMANDDGSSDDAEPLVGLPADVSLTFAFPIVGPDGATLLYHLREGVIHRMRGQGMSNRTTFAEDAEVMISGVTGSVLRPVVAPDESALFYGAAGSRTYRAMKSDFPVFDRVEEIVVPEADCSGTAPLWVSADLCSLWVFCYRVDGPGPAIVTLAPAI